MGKREDLRKQRQKQQRRKKIYLGVGIGAVLGLLAFLTVPSILSVINKDYIEDIIIPEPVFRPMVQENAMGDPEAPVRVENISNFECSHCTNFAMESDPTILSEAMILEDYVDTGKVQFVYIPYSWSPDEVYSPEAATFCAMDQGRFWEYRDIVFANVNNPKIVGLNKSVLISFAEKLNLNMPDFKKCLNDKKYPQRVKDDIEYARSIGLEGTPSFLVNDKLVFRSELVATIENALAGTNPENSSEEEPAADNPAGKISTANIIIPDPVERSEEFEYTLGDPEAPVRIESFSNYECGYCKQFITGTQSGALTETSLINDYVATGEAYFVYKTYSWSPEEPFGPDEAAYCAMDQGSFWDYRDLVFANVSNQAIGGINKDSLYSFAEFLKLDMEVFNTCFESHKYLQQVSDDVEYARSVGMTGTPSFLVNGKIVGRGTLITTIEEALVGSAMSKIANEKGYTDFILPELVSRPQVIGNSMGNPEAAVRVVNISNYSCGHCSTFALDENLESINEARLVQDYITPGKVQFVYLPYTWTPDLVFSPEEAAYCAMDQGKFWEYRDMIFLNKGNQKIGDLNKENLLKFAEILSLDMEAFETCFEAQTYHQKVIDDREFSLSIGLEGTPSFLVNETLVFRGELIETIEAELAAAGIVDPESKALSDSSTPQKTAVPAPESVDLDDIILAEAHERPNIVGDTIGDSDAPVKMEFISNFLCGNCSNFVLDTTVGNIHETLVLEDYIKEGSLQYTYVPYSWTPEEYFSPEEATYCAMDQGMFWEYRDLVHRNKNNEQIGKINKTSLTAFAELLELDMTQFNDCFENFKYHQKVLDNVTYAAEIGPINTLYFYVNGEVIHSTALEDLVARIESELK
ncbi:MAG: thioredoxin domain-containing protein [Anaerolineaceae bacterium]|nr:thioredoxin domain-containing protein [Anaerolineaceae bacterium]